MRVLIAGGQGFIGKHLIENLLSSQHEIHVVSRKPGNIAGVQSHVCDLVDEAQTVRLVDQIKPERVFHLAGTSRVNDEAGLPPYFEQNVLTTTSLLKGVAALNKPVTFFLASSAHVYGNQEGVVNEQSPPQPASFYGFSKYLAEQALRQYTLDCDFIRGTVGRLYSCIGPGQGAGFAISDLAAKVKALPAKGGVLQTGPLEAVRSFIDVRDLATVLSRLVEATPANRFEIYNVGADRYLSIREVLNILLKLSGKTPEIQSALAGPNAFKSLKMGTERLQALGKFTLRPLEDTLADILRR